jgi:putative oxygen-independent coproporphyrinogen III oxidase
VSLIADRFYNSQADRLTLSAFGVPTAAYIHIPFCRRRCYYCDFAVSVVGDKPPTAAITGTENWQAIASYVDVLCQEILATPALGRSLQTIFFGGGTPSLLTVSQLEQILQTLDRQFEIAADAEISIEIDPGTFDLAKLQGYQAAGVNRVSMGVQAFQAELLAACGRTHTPTDIDIAVETIRQAQIANFSLDLISGLPHQTLAHWQDSLERAIALSPAHLSVYDLTVEPETAFGRWYQPGVSPLPSDDLTAAMYRLSQKVLTQVGYEHYEISNYAQPGYQCRHNRVYWENQPYYAFGMGAASYVQGQRFTRPRKRSEYFPWVEKLIAANGKIDCPVTPANEVLLDRLMLGLRLAEGLSLAELAAQFGTSNLQKILHCLQPFDQQGWLAGCELPDLPDPTAPHALDALADQRIRLSDPEGFLFSNVILTALFETLS